MQISCLITERLKRKERERVSNLIRALLHLDHLIICLKGIRAGQSCNGSSALFLDRKRPTIHRWSKTSSTPLAQLPGSPQIVDHCRCDWNRTVYRSTLLPASHPETNQQRSFHAHFLSDAVTTEFPSPGDDRIQFHAVSLLEASIFTKAVS